MSYGVNLEIATLENEYFRRVLYTTPLLQLVVMSLQPDEDIGTEIHHKEDQFIRVETGTGKAIIDGIEYQLTDGYSVVIPHGAEHNIINTGHEKMKLYTIYTPAHHVDGTIHHTKADAEAAEMHGGN